MLEPGEQRRRSQPWGFKSLPGNTTSPAPDEGAMISRAPGLLDRDRLIRSEERTRHLKEPAGTLDRWVSCGGSLRSTRLAGIADARPLTSGNGSATSVHR